METHFTWLDALVLLIYFIGTMGIGVYFYSRTRSTEGFTAASRSLPGWVCGLSIFATYLSSISFLALPGNAYGGNWNAFVFSLSLPIAAVIAVHWFLPYYRTGNEVSAYARLEARFGPWARVYAGVCYLLTQLARMATVMYLMALPVSVLTGIDIRIIILVTGATVMLYTFLGGITAVIWADALQAVLLMGGALVCLIVMLAGMPEGPMQVFEIAQANDKFSLGSFGPSLVERTFWVVLVYGLAINLQNFGVDQNYVQRYIASRSDKEARKSVWIGALLYVPVSALFFFIGTTLFAYYQVNPDDLDEVRVTAAAQELLSDGIMRDDPEYQALLIETATALTDTEIGDKVFPHFIGKRLPIGITGLLIAAVFAAGMSTVSTSLNSSATLLMLDWYRRMFNPDATEKTRMRVLYIATLVWGSIATLIGLLLVRYTDSALDMWWTLSGIFSGGMSGLFILGMVSRKTGNVEAIVGVLLGFTIITWMTVSPMLNDSWAWFRSPFHAYMIPVFGTLVILLTGLLLTRFRKNIVVT